MTIQPLSNRPREISVTEAIQPAYDRMKRMLFQPFDFTKWILIGFCAWLAGLGESGGSGYSGYNGNNGSGSGVQPGEQFRHFYHQAHDYVLAGLVWIVPAAIFLVLLLLAIWLLIIWLSSRGKFMFLHCVALDKAEVDVPWHQYAAAANSLFRFRITLGLLGLVLFLPLLGIVAFSIIKMVLQGEPDIPAIMLVVGLVMLMVPLAIGFALIRKFTMDFVVPFMFLRQATCTAAWREFWKLLAANPGKFTVYILFQIVLGMVIGVIVMAAIIATCCIACCLACCLLVLPFVGTVLLLPVHLFKRAYSLYYLAQYGPQYDVFPQPSTPPASPPPPAGLQPLTPGL